MKYDIEYSKRKSISIAVKDGRLLVKAPHGAKIELIENIILKHKKWIEGAIKRDSLKRDLENLMTEEKIAALKMKAESVLKTKIDKYANIMGLKYGRITITGAKSRFGSCSSKGNISFSYRLMLYPDAAVDYVVVHELAHLREMNHSKRFYEIIEKYLPDWKARRAMLKDIPEI